MSAVLTAARTRSSVRRQQVSKARLALVAANQPEIIPIGVDLSAFESARRSIGERSHRVALWATGLTVLFVHAGVISYFFYGSEEKIVPPEALPMTVQLVADTPPPPPQVKPPPSRPVPPPPAVSVKEPVKQQEEPPKPQEVEPPPQPVTPPMGRAGYLNNPAPAYPAFAQRQGWEGTVLLKVHVLASGRPDDVEIDKSSGHKVLDDSALNAVRGWVFVPAKQGSVAMDGWVTVPIDFKLN